MRNLKKVLSLVLAMVMVLSMMVTANAAFADAGNIDADYAEAVEVMNTLGILQGDGTNFNPKGTLTRAEAAVILGKAHSGWATAKKFETATKYTENIFTDVSGWAVPYVLYCYENSITGGTSADTYSPKKNLTGYEFAKMLLVAAGFGKHADYVGDATQTWQQKVLAKAKAVGLLSGLDIVLKDDITREQASQMALNAMKAGTTTTYTYYVVANDLVLAPNAVPTAGQTLMKTSDYFEAYVMANFGGAKVHRVATTKGGLLKEKWNTVTNYYTSDIFGRPATVYTTKAGTIYESNLYFVDAPIASYANETKAAVVAADLKGYKAFGDDNYYTVGRDTVAVWYVDVIEDGAARTETATTASGESVATVIAGLTDPNTTVEVYANIYGEITHVVAVNTYVDQVLEVIPGDDDLYILPVVDLAYGPNFESVAGYEEYDVISYNLCDGVVVNDELYTNSFVGNLSSYTSTGVYTIEGSKYVLDGYALANQSGAIETTVATGAKLVYYPGANNSILFAHSVSTAPVVITDYAYVLETEIWMSKAAPATGLAATTAVDEYTADVLVLLADGTTALWQFPVGYTAKAIAAYGLDAGDYYIQIDKTLGGFFDLGTTPAAQALDTLKGDVYTYADKALVAPLTSAVAEKNGAVAYTLPENITNTSTDTDDIIVNNDTVFVVATAIPGVYTTVKGVKALGTTVIDSGMVVGNATWVAKTEDHIEVATLVFAPGVTQADDTTADADNLVLTDGTYTVTVDAKGAHYHYTVVNSKGQALVVEGEQGVAAGIWKLGTDGKLYDDSAYAYGNAHDFVTGIYGTTVTLYVNEYMTLDSDLVIVDLVGKGLVVGSEIVYGADILYIVG